MSAIDDFACDVDRCQRAAGELIETEGEDRVLLCPRCHQLAYDADQLVTLASGDVLAWDIATGWYVLPAKQEATA